MKWIIFIFLTAFASQLPAQEVFKKDKKKGKWGFVNARGEVLIDYQFDEAEAFSNNLAAVKRKDAWGFINQAGEVKIPLEFEAVESFRLSATPVQKDGKFGLIDLQGNFLAPPVYEKLVISGNAFIIQTPAGNGLMDIGGNILVQPEYNRIDQGFDENYNLKKDGQWYKFDGTTISPALLADLSFKAADEKPYFKGCDENLAREVLKKCSEEKMLFYLFSQLRYPELAFKNGVEGMVVIAFKVDAQGLASDFEIVRDVGAGLGTEALRVVETMKEWMPGKVDGIAVTSGCMVPVKFKLE